MSLPTGALIVLVLLLLTGHGLIALADRPGRSRPRSPLELHATAVLLGAVALPLVGFHAVWLLGPLPRVWALAGMGLAGLPGLLCLRRHHAQALAARPAARPPWTLGQRLAAAALLVFTAQAAFLAATVPMHGFDATFHYAYKAKLLYFEGFGTDAWTRLQGPVGMTMTHPTYPPLVPALQLLVAWVEGGWDDDAARTLWTLFAVAPTLLLVASLSGRGRTAALLGGLSWASLPVLFYWRLPHGEPLRAVYGLLFGPTRGAERFGDPAAWSRPANWCLDGTADLPLAALTLGAFLASVRLVGLALPVRAGGGAAARADRVDVLAAGVLAAGMLWTKNEGLALIGVLVLALALARLGSRLGPGAASGAPARALPGRLLAAAGIAGLMTAGWFAAKAGLPSVDEDYPSRFAAGAVLGAADRLADVAQRFARTSVDVFMWNLTWPLLGAVVVWALASGRLRRASAECAALLVVAGGVVAYALVLLVTPWDLALLETTGIPMRLLLHLAPVAVYATFALAFAPAPGGGEGATAPA